MLQQMNRQSTQQPRYMAANAGNNYSQHHQSGNQFGSKGTPDFPSESGYRAYQQPKTNASMKSTGAYQMTDPLGVLGGNQRSPGDISQFHPSKYEVMQQNSVGTVSQGAEQGIYSSYGGPNTTARSNYSQRHNYVRQQPGNSGTKVPAYVKQSDPTRYDPAKSRDMTNTMNCPLPQVAFDEGWKQHPQVSHDNQRRAPSSTNTGATNVPSQNRRTSEFAHGGGYSIPSIDTPQVMENNSPSVGLGTSAATSVWNMNASQLPATLRVNPDFACANEVKKAFSVAGEFIWHYFHLMQTQPQMLHCFYCRDSQVAHGSSLWAHQNWHRAMGETDIGALFEEILCAKFSQQSSLQESLIVRSNVKTLEAQPTRDDGIVMQATGYVETRDLGDRPFAHTVVMKRAQDTGSYVVLHDIFVFLDDLLMNPPTSTRSYVPSQVSSAKSVSPMVPDESATNVEHNNTQGLDVGHTTSFSPNNISPGSEHMSRSEKAANQPLSASVTAVSDAAADVQVPAKPTSNSGEMKHEDVPTASSKSPESTVVQSNTISQAQPKDASNDIKEIQSSQNGATSAPQATPTKFAWKTIPKQAPKSGSAKSNSNKVLSGEKQSEVEPATAQKEPLDAILTGDANVVDFRTIDTKSYAGRLLTGVKAVPKRLGMVVKRSGTEAAASVRGDGHTTEDAVTITPNRTVWVSQMEGVSNVQIENAVAARLRGCPVEGRVVRIERMRNGPAGVIELDSPECVPMLLEKGLCINGREVRVDLYKQSPSQITREPAGQRGGSKKDGTEHRREEGNSRISNDQDDGQSQNRRFKSGSRGGRGGRPTNANPRNQPGSGQSRPNVKTTKAADNQGGSVSATAETSEGGRRRPNK